MTNVMADADSQASLSEQETDQGALITMVRERSTVQESDGETSDEEQHDRSHDGQLHRRVSRRTGPIHSQGNELALRRTESPAGSSITASDSEKSEAVDQRVPSNSSGDSLVDQSRDKAAHTPDGDLEGGRDQGESSEDEDRAQGGYEHHDARTPTRLALTNDDKQRASQSQISTQQQQSCTEDSSLNSTINYE